MVLVAPRVEKVLKKRDLKARWQRRFEKQFDADLEILRARLGTPESLEQLGRRAWRASTARWLKSYVAAPSKEDNEAVIAKIKEQLQPVADYAARGAIQRYASLAYDIGRDAGEAALDVLGEPGNFRSTDVVDARARAEFVFTNAFSNHVDEMARVIARATEPPKVTKAEASEEIGGEWKRLTDAQTSAIAVTESTHLWSSTQRAVYKSYQVESFVWVANGPKPCEYCLDNEFQGAVAYGSEFNSGHAHPPAHPNCACDLAPLE